MVFVHIRGFGDGELEYARWKTTGASLILSAGSPLLKYNSRAPIIAINTAVSKKASYWCKRIRFQVSQVDVDTSMSVSEVTVTRLNISIMSAETPFYTPHQCTDIHYDLLSNTYYSYTIIFLRFIDS